MFFLNVVARLRHEGAPKAPPGAWASCVRVVDPRAPPGNQTKQIVELDSNEAALCACHAYFPAADELFLVVGSVVGLTFAPRDCAGGFLSLYTYDAEHGHTPEAMHSYGQVGLSLSAPPLTHSHDTGARARPHCAELVRRRSSCGCSPPRARRRPPSTTSSAASSRSRSRARRSGPASAGSPSCKVTIHRAGPSFGPTLIL